MDMSHRREGGWAGLGMQRVWKMRKEPGLLRQGGVQAPVPKRRGAACTETL